MIEDYNMKMIEDYKRKYYKDYEDYKAKDYKSKIESMEHLTLKEFEKMFFSNMNERVLNYLRYRDKQITRRKVLLEKTKYLLQKHKTLVFVNSTYENKINNPNGKFKLNLREFYLDFTKNEVSAFLKSINSKFNITEINERVDAIVVNEKEKEVEVIKGLSSETQAGIENCLFWQKIDKLNDFFTK